jgi:hypothetical protein
MPPKGGKGPKNVSNDGQKVAKMRDAVVEVNNFENGSILIFQ